MTAVRDQSLNNALLSKERNGDVNIAAISRESPNGVVHKIFAIAPIGVEAKFVNVLRTDALDRSAPLARFYFPHKRVRAFELRRQLTLR